MLITCGVAERLYALKQRFDDEHPQPSVALMPLVETTNLATTLLAQCQLNSSGASPGGGGGGGAAAAWYGALASFGAKASAAVASIGTTRSRYAPPCPEGEVCDDLGALSKAWVCGAAAAYRLPVPACA